MKNRLNTRRTQAWPRVGRWATIAMLVLCSAGWPSLAQGHSAPWWDCDWDFRRQLTFDNSGQAEDLLNFPVLVLLTSSRIDYGQTKDAGEDLRFIDDDGTVLDHEIEKWDEAGTSYVWVNIPQIDGSASTDHIWMYYGNPSASDGQDVTGVWDTNYVGVWHLKEDPSGAAPQIDDSSGSNDGTMNGSMTTSDQVAGQIGGSLDFDGSDDWFNLGDDPSLHMTETTSVTFSAWINTRDSSVSQNILRYDDLDNSDGDATMPRNLYLFRILDSSKLQMTYGDDGPPLSSISSTATLSNDTWYHVVAVRDVGADTETIYIDGSLDNSETDTSTGTWETTGQYAMLGKYATFPFDGQIDEVRFSDTARSADWIAAQYLSQSGSFITYGSQESSTSTVSVSYFSPDAAAAGMNVPVTFVRCFTGGTPTVTTSSSDIIVGPSIMTDDTGAVVTQDGIVLSTLFFVKPSAPPTPGITVFFDGAPDSQTFDIVIPSPDPNVTGTASLAGRSKRGTVVLGGLTVEATGNLTIDTTDSDSGTAGNQGYLPAMILVKGDVDIKGTLDGRGSQGQDGGADSTGGQGGSGGPGGGGGGGGGVREGAAGGGITFDNVTSDPNPAGTTQFTISHTLNAGSGNNRKVLVSTGHEHNTPAANVTGITFNGVAMSSVGGQTVTTSIDNRVEMWEINDADLPASSGAYDVVITMDTDPGGLGVGITSWTGVAQQPAEATASATLGDVGNPTISANITTLTDGALIMSIVGNGQSGSYTHGADQTERWDHSPTSAVHAGTSEIKATAGTETVSHTSSDPTPNRTTMFVAAFAPVSGGGSTAAPGAAGHSGGGGGASKGSGSGGAGGEGSGAAGGAASGATGGDGGPALAGATGGGGASPHSTESGGGGGGGGTGNPFGAGGVGPGDDGGAQGQGGGGGGAAGTTPGGGGGGAFATAGGRGPDLPDAGFGGSVTGNAQLVPLMGGSGGGGGGPDADGPDGHRGGGGGGGGAAVLLYASGSITVTGTIDVNGAAGGAGINGSGGGGGGSGGAMLLQSGDVTVSGTLDTGGAAGGTSTGNAAGGAGGDGRIRIDGLASGSVPGTAGSKFIGPVIDTLVGTTVTGRADGGASITLYVYDESGAEVTGSPYTTSASGATGTVGTWSISGVTFPSGTNYLAVKQTSGSVAVFGPGRATKGVHLINWREVY